MFWLTIGSYEQQVHDADKTASTLKKYTECNFWPLAVGLISNTSLEGRLFTTFTICYLYIC